MATQLLVAKKRNGLVPVSEYDWDLFDTIPRDRPMVVKCTMPNSIKHHRFYWTLLGKVVANHPFYKRSEQLHLWIKTRLGYVNEMVFHDGEVVMKVDSTSFDNMDGLARAAFIRSAVDLIVEEILPGIKRGPLLDEVESMVGTSYSQVTALAYSGDAVAA